MSVTTSVKSIACASAFAMTVSRSAAPPLPAASSAAAPLGLPIKASHHGDDLPQHFVLESCPEGLDELRGRNAFLAGVGLTGIWFETKR